MPKTVTIQKTTEISSPLEKVWSVSATDFEHIARWDGNVKASQATPEAFAEAPVGGRVCSMYSGGQTIEKIVAFDKVNRKFAYEIVKGLPGFVVTARNTWTFAPISDDKTQLTMRIDMQVKGFLGTIMQGPMKSQMGKVLTKAQEELKHFIELTKPHPRKSKKISKHGAPA